MNYSIALAFLVVYHISGNFAATIIDCQRPPQLVDPALCCQDGGRNEIAENCARRMGLNGEKSSTPPSVEVATCLAECILTESKYMQQPETISMDVIRADLQATFANDTAYVETMVDSFKKCLPGSKQKLAVFKQMPLAMKAMQRGCSPFSGMLLGCTYMEYFKNCPANRWTDNAECRLAQQFVNKCSLGA